VTRKTDLPFARVILEDFEFISVLGERPDVVCGVFHDLDTGQTIRLWRDQLGEQPPYDIGPDTLVVSFVFNAEVLAICRSAGCCRRTSWTSAPNSNAT
jgi:hypothetical protein